MKNSKNSTKRRKLSQRHNVDLKNENQIQSNLEGRKFTSVLKYNIENKDRAFHFYRATNS